MTIQVTATVVGGMLKLDQSLPFEEHGRVKLTIESLEVSSRSAVAWESLKARIRQRPVHSDGQHYTRDELHERH